MKKAVLIFLGFNQRAVVAFLRTLKKTKTAFGIIAASRKDTILLSDYGARVLAVRE